MPLTVPEVRRLLWQLLWQKQAAPEAVFAWSTLAATPPAEGADLP